MGVIETILIIAAIGFVVFLCQLPQAPINATFKTIIFWVGIAAIIWLLLTITGIIPWILRHDVQMPRV